MTAESLYILVASISLVLVILALIGSIAPVLPGPMLAYVAILVIYFTKVYHYHWLLLALLGLLAIAMAIMDYVSPILGTKKLGAGKSGMRGSQLGVFIGILATIWLGPLALIIGPFLGATVGELTEGKPMSSAIKVGTGALVGFLVGTIGKLIAVIIISCFIGYGLIKAFPNF